MKRKNKERREDQKERKSTGAGWKEEGREMPNC
jgi:hypothetical protein